MTADAAYPAGGYPVQPKDAGGLLTMKDVSGNLVALQGPIDCAVKGAAAMGLLAQFDYTPSGSTYVGRVKVEVVERDEGRPVQPPCRNLARRRARTAACACWAWTSRPAFCIVTCMAGTSHDWDSDRRPVLRIPVSPRMLMRGCRPLLQRAAEPLHRV
jgi:hypothetical protein